MKPEEIREGVTYHGGGVCYSRTVDMVWKMDGRERVHWHTPNTLPARWADGRTFHTPNRSCWLDRFARWAEGACERDSE